MPNVLPERFRSRRTGLIGEQISTSAIDGLDITMRVSFPAGLNDPGLALDQADLRLGILDHLDHVRQSLRHLAHRDRAAEVSGGRFGHQSGMRRSEDG